MKKDDRSSRHGAVMAVTAAVFALTVGMPLPAFGGQSELAERLAGRILLQVEAKGEAWYVDPVERERHFMGRPADAFGLMRRLGLGITDSDLSLIPEADSGLVGDAGLSERLAGRILLQVEAKGEAWYVDPVAKERHFMGRPADAFGLMRRLGLGITDSDLTEIAVAGETATEAETAADGLDYSYRAVDVGYGTFQVHVLTVDRSLYRPVTATASANDCSRDCPLRPLADYATDLQAVAGINGSYFCPADYASCANSAGSYLWPVYDLTSDRITNEVNLKYHERALAVADDSGQTVLYRNAKTDFGWSLSIYENVTGRRVAAALGNYPSLVFNGFLVAASDPSMETSMATVKGRRGGWGWNEDSHILAVADNATVTDLAAIMLRLGSKYAINLDGGGSSALWQDGQYRVGPGRLLPNALLFIDK